MIQFWQQGYRRWGDFILIPLIELLLGQGQDRRKFTQSSVATLEAMLPKASASEVVGPGQLTMEAFPALVGCPVSSSQ